MKYPCANEDVQAESESTEDVDRIEDVQDVDRTDTTEKQNRQGWLSVVIDSSRFCRRGAIQLDKLVQGEGKLPDSVTRKKQEMKGVTESIDST